MWENKNTTLIQKIPTIGLQKIRLQEKPRRTTEPEQFD